MAYQRSRLPPERTVIEEHPATEYRVVYEDIHDRIAIEHGTGAWVHQGLRFEDPETIDRLIGALQEYRKLMGGQGDRDA